MRFLSKTIVFALSIGFYVKTFIFKLCKNISLSRCLPTTSIRCLYFHFYFYCTCLYAPIILVSLIFGFTYLPHRQGLA